jgi:hypothetical protein
VLDRRTIDRFDAADIHVLEMKRSIGSSVKGYHPRRSSVIDGIEQQQIDRGRIFGKNAEIHAVRIHGRTERKAFPHPIVSFCKITGHVHPPNRLVTSHRQFIVDVTARVENSEV